MTREGFRFLLTTFSLFFYVAISFFFIGFVELWKLNGDCDVGAMRGEA